MVIVADTNTVWSAGLTPTNPLGTWSGAALASKHPLVILPAVYEEAFVTSPPQHITVIASQITRNLHAKPPADVTAAVDIVDASERMADVARGGPSPWRSRVCRDLREGLRTGTVPHSTLADYIPGMRTSWRRRFLSEAKLPLQVDHVYSCQEFPAELVRDGASIRSVIAKSFPNSRDSHDCEIFVEACAFARASNREQVHFATADKGFSTNASNALAGLRADTRPIDNISIEYIPPMNGRKYHLGGPARPFALPPLLTNSLVLRVP